MKNFDSKGMMPPPPPHKQRRKSGGQSKEITPAQSFYRIALQFTGTLGPKIPEEFRQDMENEIEAAGGQQLATLMVSRTERWNVRLNKDEDGNLVFKDGWDKFYADNSLDNKDHLLVFTYHGRLRFTADVFDNTGIRLK